MKKANIPFLVLVPILLLSGCRPGQSGEDKTKTNLIVTVFDGTCRTQYMDNCARRFETAHAEDSFEPGRKGVKITVKSVANVPNDKNTISKDASDIFLDENKPNIYFNSHEGLLMNINEVVNPILNKIDPNSLDGCLGSDSNYYALPHYSWYTGLTYNKTIFDDNLLYFADPEEINVAQKPESVTAFYGSDSVEFIGALSAQKSVGPDGISGTDDDGLPSSLQEFAIWSAFAESKKLHPFRMAGAQPTYSMYITHGIWSALAGEEKMKAFYQNYSANPIEVVKKDANNKTILKDEDLFFAGSGIKAPETESVVIDGTNGYRAFDMVERYYSLAFLKLIYTKEWLYTRNSNDSHTYAMNDFINGTGVQTDKRSAILCDASYWYHEADTYTKKYKEDFGEAPNLSYMPLPVNFKDSVTEKGPDEAANKQTLMNVGSAYVYVNSKTANDAGKKAATLSFLSFMYSDDELKAFSELTGLKIPVSYSYSTEEQDTYYQNLSDIVSEANVVQFASSSNVFKLNKSSFTLYYNSNLTELTIGTVSYPSQSYMGPLKDGHSAATLFDAGGMSSSVWNNLKRKF